MIGVRASRGAARPPIFAQGTGSTPPFAQGWHRSTRPAVSAKPFGESVARDRLAAVLRARRLEAAAHDTGPRQDGRHRRPVGVDRSHGDPRARLFRRRPQRVARGEPDHGREDRPGERGPALERWSARAESAGIGGDAGDDQPPPAEGRDGGEEDDRRRRAARRSARRRRRDSSARARGCRRAWSAVRRRRRRRRARGHCAHASARRDRATRRGRESRAAERYARTRRARRVGEEPSAFMPPRISAGPQAVQIAFSRIVPLTVSQCSGSVPPL